MKNIRGLPPITQKANAKLTPLVALVVSVLLCFASAIPTSHARDKNPPEVEALIGMRIPAKAPGRGGNIPEWMVLRGTVLGSHQPQLTLGVEELYQGEVIIFVIDLQDDKDKSRTILDAQVLPQHMLSYYIKNGKVMAKEGKQLYGFESMCERARFETVLGLMRPELGKEDCTHMSKQVVRAWQIDERSGRIAEISPQGVSCYWQTEYACE